MFVNNKKQHPRAGLNTQHVLDEQYSRAGRNTQPTKSEELMFSQGKHVFIYQEVQKGKYYSFTLLSKQCRLLESQPRPTDSFFFFFNVCGFQWP